MVQKLILQNQYWILDMCKTVCLSVCLSRCSGVLGEMLDGIGWDGMGLDWPGNS